MALNPHLRRRRDPSGNFENVLMIPPEVPPEDRLVVGNPISQQPQMVQRTVDLLPRQRRMVRERSTQRRPPESHLVVRSATRVVEATSVTQQRDPEPERERCHHPRRFDVTPVASQFRLRSCDACQATAVNPGPFLVVPLRPEPGRELDVHGVAQRHLKPLQRCVERRAESSVPSVDPSRSRSLPSPRRVLPSVDPASASAADALDRAAQIAHRPRRHRSSGGVPWSPGSRDPREKAALSPSPPAARRLLGRNRLLELPEHVFRHVFRVELREALDLSGLLCHLLPRTPRTRLCHRHAAGV